MTILCSGVSGFFGTALVRAMEDPVLALVRAGDVDERAATMARRTGAAVSGVRGDVRLPRWGLGEHLDALRTRVRLVVHSAAITSWTASWQALAAVNVEGARHAVQVAAALDVPLVHISSLYAAYRPAGVVAPVLYDEAGELTKYERSKCRAEWAVADAAVATGVPTRIVRIGALAGDRASGRGQPVAPLARTVQAAAAVGLVPYAADARIDVAPRDLVAERVAEWLATPVADDLEVVHVGQGNRAPLVATLLGEVLAQGLGNRRPLRAVRLPASLLREASRWADRFGSGATANVAIGARYFASSAIYDSEGLGAEVGPVELAATLSGARLGPREDLAPYFQGWLS